MTGQIDDSTYSPLMVSKSQVLLMSIYLDIMGDEDIREQGNGWMHSCKNDYLDGSICYYHHRDVPNDKIGAEYTKVLDNHLDPEGVVKVVEYLMEFLNNDSFTADDVMRLSLKISPNSTNPALAQFSLIRKAGLNTLELMFFTGAEAIAEAHDLKNIGTAIKKH